MIKLALVSGWAHLFILIASSISSSRLKVLTFSTPKWIVQNAISEPYILLFFVAEKTTM